MGGVEQAGLLYTSDNNQGNGSHDHQIQAFRPSAPATAVATVIITFRISVQVFFFVLELIGILF